MALAWVLAQGENFVPIPGTKRVAYLEDNMGALRVTLSDTDLAEIDQACEEFQVAGERYTKDIMAMVHA